MKLDFLWGVFDCSSGCEMILMSIFLFISIIDENILLMKNMLQSGLRKVIIQS